MSCIVPGANSVKYPLRFAKCVNGEALVIQDENKAVLSLCWTNFLFLFGLSCDNSNNHQVFEKALLGDNSS